jgi:hypothetical protein
MFQKNAALPHYNQKKRGKQPAIMEIAGRERL